MDEIINRAMLDPHYRVTDDDLRAGLERLADYIENGGAISDEMRHFFVLLLRDDDEE